MTGRRRTDARWPGRASDEVVLQELEPLVGRLLDRHLATAREWWPHTFVPWSDATDFDGPLGGAPWQANQSILPAAVQDALLVNLLTEDNLPSYHFEIAVRFGLDGAWGTWVHRWTAEEARHSEVLRAFVHARRVLDPVSLEKLRMQQVSTGYSSGLPGVLHGLAYVIVQELATREAHRNTGRACDDPVAGRLMARIAADENLHMIFYRDLFAEALALDADSAICALADVVRGFRMPGATIPGFGIRALRIATAGIYSLDVHREHVLEPLLRALGVLELGGLGPSGAQGQQDIGDHLTQLERQAARARQICQRLAGAGAPTFGV